MPAQKRSLPDLSPPPPPPQEEDGEKEEEDEEEADAEAEGGGGEEEQNLELGPKQEEDDSDDEDDDGSGSEKDEVAKNENMVRLNFKIGNIINYPQLSNGEYPNLMEKANFRFISVQLADIRKDVQCPICLGIIRKTRTVMECLHRFCRECIDKSMRLGNNECPACRTHCASRRSLRDDPNFDALIAALYPDIDEYEEEELAFHDEEKNRNKKIQASIAETFRRQSEALGKRKSTAKTAAAAFARKSQASYRNSHGQRGRGRISDRDLSLAVSEDDEEEDANGNGLKESSSSDEPSPERRQKRPRRSAPRSSLAHITGNIDITHEEHNDVETRRDNRGTSPLQVGNREVLTWGRGGVRSQIRHGNNGSKFVKGGRVTKLVEYIRSLKDNDNEFDMHLALVPMDVQSVAKLQSPYICCRPNLSIRQLCQFIALQTSVNAEEVEIFARKPSTLLIKAEFDPSEELQAVGPQESLEGLRDSYTNTKGELVLVYRLKPR